MTNAGRAVIVAALAVLAGTTFVAPYRYHGRPFDANAYAPSSGTVYLSLWSSPDPIRTGVDIAPMFHIDDLALDAGQLALWWLGIAAVAGGVIAMLPRRRG